MDPSIMDNITKKSWGSDPWSALFLVDVAIYRGVPQFLKKYIHNGGEWLLSSSKAVRRFRDSLPGKIENKLSYSSEMFPDIKFINGLKQNIRIGKDNPVFKFIHMIGSHGPFDQINGKFVKDLEKVKQGRFAYKKKYISTIEYMNVVIDKLKQKKIYDNTMIVIVGDHGSARTMDNRLKTELLNLPQLPATRMNKFMSRGVPLFLVKHFNENGPLRISETPVSSSDVLSVINSSSTDEFIKNLNPRRIRKYINFNEIGGEWSKPVRNHSEQLVLGHSWKPKSWVFNYWKKACRDKPNKIIGNISNYDFVSSIDSISKSITCNNKKLECSIELPENHSELIALIDIDIKIDKDNVENAKLVAKRGISIDKKWNFNQSSFCTTIYDIELNQIKREKTLFLSLNKGTKLSVKKVHFVKRRKL
jgi:hypothetical protein